MEIGKKLDVIRVRLSEEDKKMVKEMANRHKLNMSDYIRMLIINDIKSMQK